MELWERRYVTEAIARLSAIENPSERLERLFIFAVTPGTGRIDVALTEAANTDATIADTVRRVQEARVELLAEIYRQLGLDAPRARQLAVLALMAQVGMAVLAETAPALIPAGEDLRLLRALLTPPE